jgi:hypothetical protein
MTSEELTELFCAWWNESFPLVPPNKQAVNTHVAFADYVLALNECLNEYAACKKENN